MANINWQNLPSETTPINSTNLNVMSAGLVNVSNEVDDTYRVNLLESRNMIDSSSLVAGDYSGQVPTTRVSTRQQLYLKAGTYTFSTNLNTTTYRYYINTLEGTPPNLTQKYNSGWQTGSSFTFTITNANEGYFVLVIGRVDSGALLVSDVSSNQFMLNEGSTATTYSSFIQNQIVVDNEKYTDTLNVGTNLDSRSRVNVLKSKNLLDLQFLQLITNSSGTVIANSAFWNVIVDTRNINSLYVSGNFSLLADNSIRVGTYSSYPVLGSTGTRLTLQANGAINTSNVNYVLFAFGISSSSVTWDQVKASFMINEGSTALPYEPYITPSIYVDNEMLVSKNVYSTGEVVIGEWLGKPLYRRTITSTGLTTNAVNDIQLSDYSTMEIKNIYGSNVGNTGLVSPINTFWGSDTSSQRASCHYLGLGKLRSYCGQYLSTNNKYDTYIAIEYTKTTDA